MPFAVIISVLIRSLCVKLKRNRKNIFEMKRKFHPKKRINKGVLLVIFMVNIEWNSLKEDPLIEWESDLRTSLLIWLDWTVHQNFWVINDHLKVWSLLFPDEILEEIIIHNNEERQKSCKSNTYRQNWIEILLGLLLFTSMYNSSHERLSSLLATNGRHGTFSDVQCVWRGVYYGLLTWDLMMKHPGKKEKKKIFQELYLKWDSS